MKLSDLVNYRAQLDTMSVVSMGQHANSEIEKITHTVSVHGIQVGDFANILQEKKSQIQQAFATFETDLELLKVALDDLIDTTEKPWFQESYRLYEQEMIHETSEYILSRRADIAPETEQFYRTRLQRYNSWHYPTMIIRPGRETYINELVASDPMYLVDENQELLTPCVHQFNEQYRQRLLLYTINERQDQEILAKLPNGQFGLVFAYNFFNFKPFEVIKKYLTEVYQKLRPGGTLAITFNDCDRPKAVMLVEQHFCCYTPGYLVRELAQRIGYEIMFSWTDQGPTTWLELRKPGELTSLRGGQSLARIMPKPVAESK
jgi:SAM-dependent methyltransferase